MINNGLLWFLLMASPINSQNASIDISFVNATTAATPTQTTQTTLNSTNISTSIYIQSTTRSIIQFTPTPLPPVHSCFDCKISGCQNYGTCIGGNCQCPDGFGGLDCIQPVCGSLATTNSLRPILDRNQCQCADGFDGLNCNICVKDDSCRYLPNAPLGASTLCNQSPRVWNEDHMSFCRISNPLLTGFFSEKGSLTISRSLKTKSAFATMWLNSLPQFSCNATACAQSNTNSSTTWACSTGSCSCVKGSKFCGYYMIQTHNIEEELLISQD
ncbi:hypothetical protein BC833DRAFT_567131 [Globomyces pollinis-pini]|nr:hypothetical protein BC833DRAFT_567131 [Globomyces pollinis-pini]